MSTIDMTVKAELASRLTDYIWYQHVWRDDLNPPDHTYVAENGDHLYQDYAQDIFLKVLDLIDEELGDASE